MSDAANTAMNWVQMSTIVYAERVRELQVLETSIPEAGFKINK